MRKQAAVLCLLFCISSISHAEEESDITVAEAAADYQASGKKCEPNHSTAIGIVTTVVEGSETPVMISPISVKSTYTLSKGAPVLWNSKIVTTANSRVMILLADNSTLSIGPNSEVKMDSFIFDPCDTRNIKNAVNGLVRAIGGPLVKDPPNLKKSTSAMGIRG